VLGEIVAEAASRFRDRTAYVAPSGWPLSYRELDRLSDDVAAGLRRRGVGEGDVVALVLPIIPEYVIAYVAAAKVGAITAGVNARLAPPERDKVLELADPKLVVATEDLAPATGRVERVVAAARVDDALVGLRNDGDDTTTVPDDDERPLAIIFTSGTTGTPKGALFCNRQLRAITAIDIGDRWDGGGRSQAATSLAHLGPMTKLPGGLRLGGTSYLTLRWRADEALSMIEKHRMSSTGGIPTQLALMLRDPSFDERDLTCVEAIVIGGGPATAALVREARARFHAALAVRYSCTEAGIGTGTAFDAPEEDAEISVGRPQPGVELAVLDPDGRPVTAGEVGDVCLRSPAAMSCYWGDADATAAAFTADGFVRTGDLGWVDDEGRLRLAGRTKEMYVRGGYNVYPMEVETVLAEHPAVAAVAVVPRADPVMGEVGVAVVVPRSAPATAQLLDELRAHGRERLAGYKLPDDVMVVDQLPLTAMEKIDRRALAEFVARSAGTTVR
jgi:acyl-CoA synthetase (AMP-forming)/AMP-acid ligase II